MNKPVNIFASLLLLIAFTLNALPCGPAYLTPLFDSKHAPENPYEDFAAGKIGILKPSYNRSVLFAAYRYLNGGGFNSSEQKAMVDVWKAEFDNKDYKNDDISEFVKAWIDKRKDVVGKEEQPPTIYVEREYGGYDFFPNCTGNAFEVATQTLSDRTTSYGSDDKNVKEWIAAQDEVFQNCASGKDIPAPADSSKPEWLQKDRAYQIAAAEFYSLDYNAAKHHFREIAQDDNSPWKETADYLVGRTLIRQASLSKDESKADMFLTEAEQNLALVASRSTKFGESASRLLGLVKYRLRPQERVRELARNLTYGGNEDFRQNLIDYNWLLDKFEKEELEKVEKIKEEERKKLESANTAANPATDSGGFETGSNTNTTSRTAIPHDEDDLEINFYAEPQSYTFYIKPDATEAEAIAAAEGAIGKPLTNQQKEQLRLLKQSAYTARFTDNRSSGYSGGYYGEEKTSLSILPAFLRADDLTDWLFTFQIEDNEAYLYSLSKYRETDAQIWLMTAISKAKKNSTDLNRLITAAQKTGRSDPAYPTVAYNLIRIYMEQGRNAEARKLLEEVLDAPIELPVSSRNLLLDVRVKFAEDLDDFLKYSLRKPFAFDYDGQTGTIDEFIAEQKKWYDEKNSEGTTREEYERKTEEDWKYEKAWQDRELMDSGTIEIINNHFPLAMLLQVEKSPAIPDYLRDRFLIPIWTRALLTNDMVTVRKIAPDVIKIHPEFEKEVNAIINAKTPAAAKNASLFMILKNPVLSPWIEEGLGKTDNELNMWDGNDWWCSPYDTEYDEATDTEAPRKVTKPAFLTSAQSAAAQAERKKLKELGDAPAFLGKRVLDWAKISPLDKRIPESLYIVYEANGWTKYGCGNNEQLKAEIAAFMKKRYPGNEWTLKTLEEEQPAQ
jgi:hypothetical protein